MKSHGIESLNSLYEAMDCVGILDSRVTAFGNHLFFNKFYAQTLSWKNCYEGITSPIKFSLGRQLGDKVFCFVGIPQKCHKHTNYRSGNKLSHNCWELNQVFVRVVNYQCK